ncbi:MAG: acyl-CoA dehydrogenase family protein [Thermoplasmataceae archaeon]|jgi:alkylation response protein AidB-like acyl-CoA dehydrogenase
MDFDLPQDIEDHKKKVQDFARSEFTQELARKYDQEEKFPFELKKKAFDQGIVDFSSPWKSLVAIEELCRVDPGLGISVTVPYFGAETIMLFGSDTLKEKYLAKVNAGKAIMGLAVTEPGGGSDVAGIKTEAKKVNSKYIINGSKMFITNGSIADFFVMLVRTSKPDDKRHHGLSVLVVDSNSKGFTSNKLTGKLGVRATDTAELILNDVEVPEENLVGEEGKGFYYIMTFFNISRIFVAAQGLGVAQGSLDRTMEILRTMPDSYRNLENVSFTIAEMATRIEAAKLLTYKAASYLFQFKPKPEITSMAKAYASETAVFCAEKALELTGLKGITGDLERYFRDAKILEIWEGTSEIEKLVISRFLNKEVAQ